MAANIVIPFEESLRQFSLQSPEAFGAEAFSRHTDLMTRKEQGRQ